MSPQLPTSKTYTLEQLLLPGIRLSLPLFQREYTWKPQQCGELWTDIQAADQPHYMGAVTLQPVSAGAHKKYQIIDGQQRLVSLSLMALACARHLEDPKTSGNNRQQRNNEARAIRSGFLVNGDDPNSADNLKLQLPGIGRVTDAAYFRGLVLGRLFEPDGVTQENIRRAFDLFRKRFRELENGAAYDFMRRRAGKHLLFTRIVIPSEYNAPKVFASLNARGLPLTSANLVKCHLTVTAPLDQVSACAERWGKMNNAAGEGAMPRFLCHAYNAEKTPATKEGDLHDNVVGWIDNMDKVVPYLDDLRGKCKLFCTLQDPVKGEWPVSDDFRCVQFFKAYGVTAIYPALMSAKKHIASEFSGILPIFEVVAFRRSVVGLVARPIASASQEFARKIARGEICTAADLRQQIMNVPELYPSDDVFRSALNIKAFTWAQNKVPPERLRYVVARLEAKMSNGATGGEVKAREVVRILNAADFEERDNPVVLSSNLGNFTLWENERDDPFANKNVSERMDALRGSDYRLSRDAAGSTDFTLRDFQDRQERMVNLAVRTWTLDSGEGESS